MLSIIVVTYNNGDTLKKFWESWYRASQNSTTPHRFVIVDNNSSDSTVKKIQECNEIYPLPSIKIITEKKNHGFASGVHSGVSGDEELLLCLNPDVHLPEDFFSQLLKGKERIEKVDAQWAAYAPALQDAHGNLQGNAGPEVSFLNELKELTGLAAVFGGGRWWRYYINEEKELLLHSGKVAWAGAGCLLLRADVWRLSNGFDKNFFMYGEDVEWCFRIRKLGYTIYRNAEIIVTHWGGISSGIGRIGRWRRWKLWSQSSPLLWKSVNVSGRLFLIALLTLRNSIEWIRSICVFFK